MFLPNSFMRTILTLGVALGVPALGSVATAQQTHEYFLWGGTPATTEWEIRRTADLDFNGDYFGAEEGVRFAYDGANDIDYLESVQFANIGGTATIFAVATGDVILRFVDLNGNGVCTDPGEWDVFADTRSAQGASNTSPDKLAYNPNTGELFVTDDIYSGGPTVGSGIFSYVDLNGDGDAMDAGEFNMLVDGAGSVSVAGTSGSVSIDVGDFEGIMVDSNGVVIGFAQQDRTLYAFQDMNGDGDAMDAGEAWNFCNLVGDKAGLEQNADTLSGALKNPSCPSSSGSGLYASLEILDVDWGAGPSGEDLYWIVSTAFNSSCAGASGLVYQGIDLNGDGDLNDAGEVTLFLDGPNNTSMDYPPADIYDGKAHDGGFAIFHNNGPLGGSGTYRQNQVDFVFDLNGDRTSNQVGEQETKYRWLPDGCFAVAMEVVPVGEFTVPPSARFIPFGDSDTNSSGVDAVIGNVGLPVLGQFMEVTLSGGIPGTNSILAIGTSNTMSRFGPLPRNLAGIGIPGSTLYVSDDFRFPATVDGAGNALVPVVVPNDPNLQGRSFYLQWQVVDPAANARGFILSNAAEAIVY
ncbi:MAG: hypothetical protein CMJ94_04290 [Planctomycetes bacterium]|nr:hypothetical protein [Planctomycetota bacterium]